MNRGNLQPHKTIDLRRRLRTDETEPEKILWHHIRKKMLGGYRFTRQYGVGRYVVDFYCPQKKIAIELDGAQHTEGEANAYDQERTKFITDKGIRVIRFYNNQVFNELDMVLDQILYELEKE